MTLLRPPQSFWRLFAMLLCLVAWGPARAQALPRDALDHLKTGFALDGAHARASCESCHVNGIFKGTPRDCASCHRANLRLGRGNVVMPLRHLPTQLGCESCHRTDTFVGARFNHAGVAGGSCLTCHNGSTADGKPASHVPTTASCDSCHRTGAWLPAGFNHVGVTPGTCATCHNGSRAPGKPATHIPAGTASCDGCHTSFNAWLPTAWNHTQLVVTAQCASCHTGGYPPADGRPANHIPYQSVAAAAAANCDTCHKGSYTSWANGRLHAYVSVSTGCFTCHTGGYLNAVGKPANATHATVTGNCESCHRSTTSWSSAVTFAHSAANAVGSGTCDGCHNGTTATGKPNTHIPVISGPTACDSCHRSQSSFGSAVTMNHSVVTATQCRACHNGAYVSQGPTGAMAKPANHIPEVQLLNGASIDCNGCHTSTTSWGSVRMNHNASQGNGAGWCKACHQSGTAYLGNMEKKPLTHRRTTGVTDCSQSGCHRPLGSTGAAYTRWD